jgi:hypothetical protein
MPQNDEFSGFTAENIIDLLLMSFTGATEPTPALVEAKVDEFLVGPFAQLSAQRPTIIDEILRRIRVRIGTASTLDERGADHVPWLTEADRSKWRFWPRLNDYLRRIDRLPPSVLQELDFSTDQSLERLESPDRSGRWDRRGLVVGHVQSGKTTHYTALTAKALDAGYEIIIILAGTHNSLRSQTHERLDRHLIGRDSAALVEALRSGATNVTIGWIGVGDDDRKLGKPPLPFTILTCTTSAEDGDFRTQIANQVGFQVSPGSRLVLVVKKNGTILRNLTRWLRTQNSNGSSDSSARIAAPTLVIDDEADHASVNTSRDPDEDPTTINKLIRLLLVSFDRVGFVGYTATPFANIFIGVDTNHNDYGPDLFPRSFIVNLKAPSDYIGPSLVFGHPGDESAGIPEQSALPMYIPVRDATTWLPDKHNKNQIPGPLPETLKEAVRLFILACAARACRGDIDVHNSMLVHATRFVNVQGRVAEQIDNELIGIRNIISSGSREQVASVKAQLEDIWRRRLLEPHEQFRLRLGDRCNDLPTWEEVWQQIPLAAQRIKVMRINGTSTDALTYSRNPKGIYVIAIGGDKLSRGLTLEGLSVSYFLRTSNMFDTLMQMGRWFGYRPRYADLCRVYTTPYLYAAFQEIALAMDDLRADLDQMAEAGKTPRDFGLRVRTPSDGLLITAVNKIRRGEPVSVRFAGSLVQSLEIPRSGAKADEVRANTKRFIRSLGSPNRQVRGTPSSHFIWPGKPVSEVLEFLSGYEAYSTPSFNGRCEALRRYIREQVGKGELTEWTIALVSKQVANQIKIGELSVSVVDRKERESPDPTRFSTQAVVGGRADEAIDLSVDEFQLAIRNSPADPKRPSGRPELPSQEAIREARPPGRGLLLIYLLKDPSNNVEFIPAVAVSFPESATAQPLAYTVNEVWRQEYGLVEDALDGDIT